ncbi:MAG: galactokinase [Chthoniobacterales bacterium]
MSPASAYAPGRVEFLGNHTDYNHGVVLAAAINRGLTVAGIARRDDSIILTSIAASDRVHVALRELQPLGDGHWANYALGVVRELERAGLEIRGFDAEISGDLTAGAGLASSAAMEVATAGLLLKLNELQVAPMEIAKLCQRAENEFAGVQSGLLDQVTSVFGRAGHLVYLDCQKEEVRTLPFPKDCVLVIAESGAKHALLQSFYNARREECAAAAHALGVESLREVTPEHLELGGDSLDPVIYRRAAHIVGENDRVWRAVEALEKNDAEAVGALLNASHESSRTNFENSSPEQDALVELARSLPGVLGARLTGGGFGGATVSLVREEQAAAVMETLRSRATTVFGCEIADGAAARWMR